MIGWLTFEENLNETLIPTGTLLNKLLNGWWCLFASNKFVIIDDTHAGVREVEANTKVSIFGQTIFIPAPQLLHQFTAHKDGITP